MVSLCVIGQTGAVKRRINENEQQKSHASQNGIILYTVSVPCNKTFPSDDDRLTSSETTSHSQIALGKYIVHSTAL